ncbi:uncharacterized protein LOC144445425 [Glandiceps talaboti]
MPHSGTLLKLSEKKVNHDLKRAHAQYIETTLHNALKEGNRKPFWRYVKSQRKDSGGVAPLKVNETLYSESHDKAEILNALFTSVFTTDRKDDIPEMYGGPYPIANEIQITESGVYKLLSTLNVSKASGPDGLPNYILKELALELTPAMTCLFNQSLSNGQLPDDWKSANVSPIYKNDDKHLASNHRPISLTFVCVC